MKADFRYPPSMKQRSSPERRMAYRGNTIRMSMLLTLQRNMRMKSHLVQKCRRTRRRRGMCRPTPLAFEDLCSHTTQRDCQTTLARSTKCASCHPFSMDSYTSLDEWDASLTLPDWMALLFSSGWRKILRWIKYPGGLSSSYVN